MATTIIQGEQGGANPFERYESFPAPPLPRSSFSIEDRKRMIVEFGSLLTPYDIGQNQTLMLVLDTFEEVQYRSRVFVKALFDFLEELQHIAPRLRTVISGRATCESPTQRQSSTSAGRRLTAIETLASFPHTEHLTWLASRIKAESAFVGYHTCVALKETALRLPVEAAAQVRTAIQDALKSLGHGPDTEGRNRVLQDALSVLPPLA